jgi:hypothetical protein
MTANPWLHQTPWPTKQLPRDEMAKRIEHMLATHWMGVLCTVGKNGPIGSPVEYYAEGMAVYILPQPGSPKLQARIRAGPVFAAPSYSARPGLLSRARPSTFMRWVSTGGSPQRFSWASLWTRPRRFSWSESIRSGLSTPSSGFVRTVSGPGRSGTGMHLKRVGLALTVTSRQWGSAQESESGAATACLDLLTCRT